jgi:hypothetical protein
MKYILKVCLLLFPLILSAKILSVSEFQKNYQKNGTYLVEGYVLNQYRCPPCPQNHSCKICMGDNILIGDDNASLSSYSCLENADCLRVYTYNPQFLFEKKYTFTIEIIKWHDSFPAEYRLKTFE